MKINRRKFMAISAAGAGTAVFASFVSSKNKFNPLLARTPKNLPSVHHSQNGLLEVDLEASYSQVNLGENPAYLLAYNGKVPAPRLEAKAGDKVRIHFTNRFDQPTNLHYHGLHLPPTGKADNVFLQIQPQKSFTYEFDIPQNQPAGTFWYHPHLHGYVADQLAAGLAGLFVIRGELDEIPEIKAAKEEFLVLQDFALDDQGRLLPSAHMSLMMGREGNVITGNGEINPVFLLPQGGLLRLRILNASTSRFYNLSLEDHPFYLIATDGGAIAKPLKMTQLLLTPGQRIEILIKGDQTPKSYQLLNLPYRRGGMGMMGGMMGGRGMMRGRGMRENAQTANTPIVLANIN